MTAALTMRWTDLAFLHWRVQPERLAAMVPDGLELDTFDSAAWVGITPFRMTRVRPLAFLPVPTASDFPELNFRTYVRRDGSGGVFFFSLDAASRLAVIGARLATGLPYYYARMRQRLGANGDIEYESVRVAGASAPAAEFQATYRATGPVFTSSPGTLEDFLTNRLSLFVQRSGVMQRLDIEHGPWPLQPGAAEIRSNTLAAAAGIELPAGTPHVLFSKSLDVTAHWPVPV